MDVQWSLVLFSLLAGCGAASFVFVAIAELLGVCKKSRFNIALVSLVVLALGGIFSVTHLGNPGRIMYAAQNIGSFSGISVELIFMAITGVLMIAYLAVEKRENAQGAAKAVAVIGALAGLVLCFVTGNGYVLEGRPAWNTLLLPLAYFGTSLASGAFLYLACAAVAKEPADDLKKIGLWVFIAAVLCAVTLVAYAATAASYGDGNGMVALVGGIVICGIVLTLVFGYLAKAGKFSSSTVGFAGLASALLGGLGLRAFMWIAGTGFLSLFITAATTREMLGF